jgi:hypothetical protein
VTAINVFRSRGVVHIATDGQSYRGDVKTSLGPKVYVAAHMPLVLATRGLSEAKWLFGSMFCQAFAGFDELVDGLESEFPNMNSTYLRFVSDSTAHDARNTELLFGGWSAARQQCEAYFIRAGDEQGERSYPSWKLIELDGLAGGPVPSTYVEVDPDHIEHDTIALMEAQRREFPLVGGFCQLTSLTEQTVTERILRRWPILPSE